MEWRTLNVADGALHDAARRLERWSIALRPEQLGVIEGLRAAVAVGAMVAASQLLDLPGLNWAAFAAFWTCLVDPGGPMPGRRRAFGLFGLTGTLLTGVMSWGAGLDPAAAPLLLLTMVLLCGLMRLHRAVTNQVSTLSSVVAVVAVFFPCGAPQAAELAGAFLLGSLFATILCTAWRIHPYRPARNALGAVYRELSDLAGALIERFSAPDGGHGGTSLLQAGHRSMTRESIERARALLDGTVAARNDATVRTDLLAALEAADRIFAGLIAFEQDVERGADSALFSARRQRLRLVRDALDEIGRQVMRQTPDWSGLHPVLDALDRLPRDRDQLAERITAVWRAALSDLVGHAPTMGGQRARRKPAADGEADRGTAPAVRHALRLSITVALVYGTTALLRLPYGYWATVAVVVVMQPQAAATLPRMLERIVGSIVGGLAAALLIYLVSSPTALMLAVFPIAAATVALRSVNYSLFVAFVTALFVLVADMMSPGAGLAIAKARALDNVLGSLFGMAGSLLLWPEPVVLSLRGLIDRAVAANLEYSRAVSTGGEDADPSVDPFRRGAGTASTAAEIALQRLVLMGRRKGSAAGAAAELLGQLRRLAGMATVVWLTGDPVMKGRLTGQETLVGDLTERWKASLTPPS